MRVPPDQSSTSSRARVSASSGSRRAQRARDVGQPRAEQEHRDAFARVGHARAGNAGTGGCTRSSSRRCRAAPRSAAALSTRPSRVQVDDLAAGAERSSQRPAQIDLGPMRAAAGSAGVGRLRERQHEALRPRASRARSRPRSSGQNPFSAAAPRRRRRSCISSARRRAPRRGRACASASCTPARGRRRRACNGGAAWQLVTSCRPVLRTRKKMSNACSKMSACSWRLTNTAWSAAVDVVARADADDLQPASHR